MLSPASHKVGMRDQFKDTVSVLAETDEKVVVVLGDISMFQFRHFKEKHPERFFNMGICENTLISVTAGLSSQGLRPFVHTIAPFLIDRSVEQIKLDMCYNGFGGNIVSTGASFDYAWDGATHHTYMDLAILRMLPTMGVVQPGSPSELDALIRQRYAGHAPTYFRLSDNPHKLDLEAICGPAEFGKAMVVRDGGHAVTVMTAGPIFANVWEAAKDLPVNIVYFHTIKPIDKAAVARFANTKIVVVHDAFGLHEAVNETPGLSTTYHGLPDEFCGWYGTVHDIRKRIGLDPAGIRARVESLLAPN
jgi:transketolase